MECKLLSHLVSVRVTADNDGFGPGSDEARNVFANNGLPEDGTAEDITDGAIGRLPHLLQFELYALQTKTILNLKQNSLGV